MMLIGALLDGVDGAVAVRADMATRWGKVLDPFADRCADLLLIATLVVLGAPLWLGVALGVLTLLLESVRAQAQAAGMTGPGVLTWWERPSRVIVVSGAVTCASAEWCARQWGAWNVSWLHGPAVATVFGTIALALAVVGLVHLLAAVRTQLSD